MSQRLTPFPDFVFVLFFCIALMALPTWAAEVLPEIGDDEYRVLTDFFASEAPKTKLPEQFDYVIKSRAIAERTGGTIALDELWLQRLNTHFGALDAGLIADYRARNTRPALIRKRIVVPHMTLVPDEERTAAPVMQERIGSLKLPGLHSHFVRVSRIGFDATKEKALFHVSLTGGGPSTGYFVLMTQADGKWRYTNAVLTRYLIH